MKKIILSILILVVFPIQFSLAEVSTSGIDNVREKQVLDDEDFSVIDEFLTNAVNEFLQIENFSSVSRLRSVILSRKNNTRESSRQQYQNQFYESANRAISNTLAQAEQIEDPKRRFKVMVNLLVLVDGFESPEVSQVALDYIDYSKKSVRYWAVHSLTNPDIINALNSSSRYMDLTDRIISELEAVVTDCSYETAVLIVEFAAGLEEGGDLLIKITKNRFEKYQNWDVDKVYFDTELLASLSEKINQSSGEEKKKFARYFSQLYSYTIQRYIKGRDVLTDEQKTRLKSLIVETERNCIGRKMDIPQVSIKQAVENNDYTKLQQEHNQLLGDDTQRGRLPSTFGFYYGDTSGETQRTAPLELSDPK